jgi:hypothetical protein
VNNGVNAEAGQDDNPTIEQCVFTNLWRGRLHAIKLVVSKPSDYIIGLVVFKTYRRQKNRFLIEISLMDKEGFSLHTIF